MVPTDIGAFLMAAVALIPATITAGAGNDGVEVDGPTIDRNGFNHLAQGGKLIIAWDTTLAAAATLSLAANMQDSPNNSTWTDVLDNYAGGALANAVVATGPGGGGTLRGVSVIDFALDQLDRYLRAQVTANLSAANTDTVRIAAVLVMGGGEVYPLS